MQWQNVFKKGEGRNLAFSRQGECACTVWTACMCVCGYIQGYGSPQTHWTWQGSTMSRFYIDVQNSSIWAGGVRKQVERESERSGGINRCLYMLWRVQAQQENKSKGGAAELGGETDAPHCQAIMERTKEKRFPVYDCSRYWSGNSRELRGTSDWCSFLLLSLTFLNVIVGCLILQPEVSITKGFMGT